MKRSSAKKITFTALCAAINIAGAYLALALRLPVYLDSIGTVLGAALLGPFSGITAACLSGIVSGITSDVYAFYYMPVGMITGLIAGLLFRHGWFRKWKFPLGVLLMTLPGTILSSCITAFVFSGVTSSGSSILVQLLHRAGLGIAAASFIVQILTDYLDRAISAAAVCTLLPRLSPRIKSAWKEKE